MDQKDFHFTGERKADRESVVCFETRNESSAVELIRALGYQYIGDLLKNKPLFANILAIGGFKK